ncbi:MAG: DUF433 domain-containing protein [Actinophytocola sp.]|nr:DUF433 domain-containing protein [Actinophytocola sp.]
MTLLPEARLHVVSDSGAISEPEPAQLPHDVRFTVPLYTSAEAARYLDVPSSTFAAWVKGRRGEFPHHAIADGAPVVTGLAPELSGGPSIPFGGLAEGMFLSALRSAGMLLRRIRPALDAVQHKLGIDHGLASRQLYVAGADLFWEVSNDDAVDDEARHGARELIVMRNGQYVFRQMIERYLRRIEYDDGYARRLHLPRYEVADIATDTETNFGRPYFAHTGTPLDVVKGQLTAGETIDDVAADFELPVDQVTEVALRDGALAP